MYSGGNQTDRRSSLAGTLPILNPNNWGRTLCRPSTSCYDILQEWFFSFQITNENLSNSQRLQLFGVLQFQYIQFRNSGTAITVHHSTRSRGQFQYKDRKWNNNSSAGTHLTALKKLLQLKIHLRIFKSIACLLRFRFPAGDSLFATASRPVQAPTRPPDQWVHTSIYSRG
jgi:hypothetical protein